VFWIAPHGGVAEANVGYIARMPILAPLAALDGFAEQIFTLFGAVTCLVIQPQVVTALSIVTQQVFVGMGGGFVFLIVKVVSYANERVIFHLLVLKFIRDGAQ
jgi:hypothetical protein